MNSITFFHRNKSAGYSIQKVFTPISKEIKKSREIKEYYVPECRANHISLLRNLVFVYRHRNKQGINHISGDIHYCILALTGCKSVLTIHDLVFIKNSETRFDRFLKYLLWLYLPVKLANRVVCISENTKQEVLKYIEVKNISVIYNSVDTAFQYTPERFNSLKPVILHIGTSWNKNLSRVIDALEDIPCHLRIIGKLNAVHIALLKEKRISYSNAHSLSDEEIVQEYQKCDIVSFPSEYEGFGMPIIEGQAIGRVVITSDIPPMTEVGNDSVVYVNPNDTQSIKNGFLEIINNSNLRRFILDKSKKNIQKFSPEKIVNQYLKLYQSIYE